MKRIPIGISSFERLREEDYYFIDKSDLCREIIEDLDLIAVLPRPRRFGKTLNISMLRCFFEKKKDGTSRRDLFKGLSIERWKDFDKHQGRYPVISFSFKEAKGRTKEEAFLAIKQEVAKEFSSHIELYDNDVFTRKEKELFDMFLNMESSVEELSLASSLLCKGLSKLYNERVMVFIDEYDTPAQAAWLNGYYDDMINFIRPFMSAAYKDNEYLMRGVVTGIMRVTKESIFSGLNNCTVYSILDRKTNSDFGFTIEEVHNMLSDYNALQYENDVKKWYDGYIFGGITIFNPWSILNYVNNDCDFKPYWVNTSSNDIIRNLISTGSIQLKNEFIQLIEGKALYYNVHVDLIFPEIKQRDDSIWSFLYFSGYLKAEHDHRNEECFDIYKLTIPNVEVRMAYINMVQTWFSMAPVTNDRQRLMLDSLRKKDFYMFGKVFQEFIIETLSFFDTSGKYCEATYQAFLLGLLVNMIDYIVTSNTEAGYGRYDIMLSPREKTKPGFIFELKTLRDTNDPADKVVADAIKQAESKEYMTSLKQQGVKDITIIGVAFDGKKVTMDKKEIS
ncbi:MAG: ATP-binding protein [Bacteroidales bacterium]|jgi:hypothetical protein|nr:ATP-binding protein [Bacteroidales bacterium]